MAVATDDFNRTDAATLGGDWTDNPTLTGMGVTSNQAEAKVGGGFNQAHRTAETFGNDQYAKVIVVHANADSFVSVRGAGDAFYMAYNPSSGGLRLFRRSPGSFAEISNLGGTVANGDEIEIQMEGTTLRGYINGVQQGSDATDENLSSGDPGIGGLDSLNNMLDDWEGGDLGGGGGATPIFVPDFQFVRSPRRRRPRAA